MRALFMVLLIGACCEAQNYPRWFLEPGNLNCGPAACGIITSTFYRTSSDSLAFLSGCLNLARQHFIEFSGGQSYWETEAGVFWMGSDFEERIDSTYLSGVTKSAKRVLASYSGDLELMLVSENDCALPDSMKAVVSCAGRSPSWIESTPQSGGFIYATGVATRYFYESSSWESAEKKARFNLARALRVSLKAMQKENESSGQEIRSEEISGSVSGVEVVSRWHDKTQGLFFVLMRAPAGN